MSSRKSRPDDELGNLIRHTLETKIERSDPSDKVWERVKTELTTEDHSQPQPKPVWLRLPVAQATFIVLAIMLSGLWLNVSPPPERSTPMVVASLPDITAQANTGIVYDEYAVPSSKAVNRSGLNQQQLLRAEFDTSSVPIAVLPFDLLPHPLSPAGRRLNAQVSAGQAVVDREVFEQFGSLIR